MNVTNHLKTVNNYFKTIQEKCAEIKFTFDNAETLVAKLVNPLPREAEKDEKITINYTMCTLIYCVKV